MEWERGPVFIAVDGGGAWLIVGRLCIAVLWHPRNWVVDWWHGSVVIGPFAVTWAGE